MTAKRQAHLCRRRRSRLEIKHAERTMSFRRGRRDNVLGNLNRCFLQSLCCGWNCGVHRDADKAVVFWNRLVLMRTLSERSCLGMSVASLCRTHKGNHQKAQRSDQPQPYCRPLPVLSTLSIVLHQYPAFNLCSTFWIVSQTLSATFECPDASKRGGTKLKNQPYV